MLQEPTISICNLTCAYNGTRIFNDLNLQVDKGAKITLYGASGTGKSTLLRCIMGFVPFESGSIYIQGKELNAKNVWEIRKKISYVFQEPDLGEGQVMAILQEPFGFAGNRALKYDQNEVCFLFQAFMLPEELLYKNIKDLSGGEKQRIALVSALLLHRDIILLDEAAASLDPESKNKVRQYLIDLKETTILSVSHDIRDFALSQTICRIENLLGVTML